MFGWVNFPASIGPITHLGESSGHGVRVGVRVGAALVQALHHPVTLTQ